jgi:hypothetical protein
MRKGKDMISKLLCKTGIHKYPQPLTSMPYSKWICLRCGRKLMRKETNK